MKINSKGVRITLVSLAAAAAIVLIAGLAGLRLNTTASCPVGVYRLSHRKWTKGDLVFVNVNESREPFTIGRERGYFHYGWGGMTLPLIKRVFATPGDTVTVARDIAVNGTHIPNSTIRDYDTGGLPLPHDAVSETVPTGYVWILSEFSPRSFDSRYFGPVREQDILGVAVPLLTWSSR